MSSHAILRKFFYILSLAFLSSCKTYYYKQQKFQDLVVAGNFSEAEKIYPKFEKPDGHNRLLYFLNMGMVYHFQAKYELSNQSFEKAYLFSQDYHKNFGTDLVNIFISPNANKYIGNPLELLLINYYKALNYSLLNDYEKAMVECKRVFSVMQYIDDQHSSDKKYQSDPYIYNMIGLIYEAAGEDNAGLVCLKRAVEIYENNNNVHFGIGVPEQLKYDVIRLSKKSGDFSAADRYLKEFGNQYDTKKLPKGVKETIVIWHNGLAPIKTETNVVFTVDNNGNGNLMMVNNDFGFQVPIFINLNQNNSNAVNNLKFIRMAIPQFKERKPLYNGAEIILGDSAHKLEMGQDFNAVDFKILKDQLLVTLTESLLRVTLRQLAVSAANKKDQDLVGLGVSLLSFVTEKADTRNWQTIPHSVYYTRVNIPDSTSSIDMKLLGEGQMSRIMSYNTSGFSSKKINFLNIVTPNVMH